jgi:hypothetical protein
VPGRAQTSAVDGAEVRAKPSSETGIYVTVANLRFDPITPCTLTLGGSRVAALDARHLRSVRFAQPFAQCNVRSEGYLPGESVM